MSKTTPQDKLTDYLTRKQLCEYLHIGMNRSYELSRRRDFPKVAFGNRHVFPRRQVQEWMDRQADIGSLPKTMRSVLGKGLSSV